MLQKNETARFGEYRTERLVLEAFDRLTGAAEGETISALSILPGEAHWRSREVRYYTGDWNSVLSVMPQFDLVPFAAGRDEPANPFLRTVMRRPLSATERPIPVRVVSHTYSLGSYRDVAALCRKGIVAGVSTSLSRASTLASYATRSGYRNSRVDEFSRLSPGSIQFRRC